MSKISILNPSAATRSQPVQKMTSYGNRTPLLHVGSIPASYDQILSANKYLVRGIGHWLIALSRRQLFWPFTWTLDGLPLENDGTVTEYPIPSTLKFYNGVAYTREGAWQNEEANGFCNAKKASAVVKSAMKLGEKFSLGRKGFVLLSIFNASAISGDGWNPIQVEVDWAVDCINKILDAGWTPIVLSPYENPDWQHSYAERRGNAQYAVNYVMQWLSRIEAQFPEVITVDLLTPMTDTANNGPISLPIGTSLNWQYYNWENTDKVRYLENPALYYGTNRGLANNIFVLNPYAEDLSEAGSVKAAVAIYDKMVARGFLSADYVYQTPMGRTNPLFVGWEADGHGNPLLRENVVSTASGSLLAGFKPNLTSFTVSAGQGSSSGGMTPSVSMDEKGRSYCRMSINQTWYGPPSNYCTGGAITISGTNVVLNDPPPAGTWLRARAVMKINSNTANIALTRIYVDPGGGQAVYSGLGHIGGQTLAPVVPLLWNREIVIETVPFQYPWQGTRLVPYCGVDGANSANSIFGNVDIYELGTYRITEDDL